MIIGFNKKLEKEQIKLFDGDDSFELITVTNKYKYYRRKSIYGNLNSNIKDAIKIILQSKTEEDCLVLNEKYCLEK